VQALAGRPGWTIEGTRGVFRPAGGDWVGQVSEVLGEVRASRRWLGVIVRGGVAVYTRQIIDPLAAADWVERQRLAPAG
jgi:hypothetical protein